MNAKILYIYALTPVHTGTGQSVDVIDLPIAREETTGWPYIPGSSIKGVLRDVCKDGADSKLFELAFGPETRRASEGAGCLIFGDARIVCLPVRSLMGTFAWVTSPLVIARLKRDYVNLGLRFNADWSGSLEKSQTAVTTKTKLTHNNKVILEDLDLEPVQDLSSAVDALAGLLSEALFAGDRQWAQFVEERLTVVHDDTFGFLCETATEVTARIRIEDKKKTVDKGGLWYEEAVPAESIFAAPLIAIPRNGASADELYGVIKPAFEQIVQIGGNASVGRGLVRLYLTGGAQ
ncbi:MAG: type III-B CRISPR module RAMP protein Cmr4 [Armatimonadota bacterium]